MCSQLAVTPSALAPRAGMVWTVTAGPTCWGTPALFQLLYECWSLAVSTDSCLSMPLTDADWVATMGASVLMVLASGRWLPEAVLTVFSYR